MQQDQRKYNLWLKDRRGKILIPIRRHNPIIKSNFLNYHVGQMRPKAFMVFPRPENKFQKRSRFRPFYLRIIE